MAYIHGRYCERRWPLRVHNLATKPVLKEREVRRIITLRERGWTTVALAEKFGITACHVSNIMAGRVWKEITC